MKKYAVIAIILLVLILVGCGTEKTPQREAPRGIPLPPPPLPPGATTSGGHQLLGMVVPTWANAWAAEPGTGVMTLSPLNSEGKFEKFDASGSVDLVVKITGYDIVWPIGYRTDTNYILTTIASGGTLNPTLVWKRFDVKKLDGTAYNIDPRSGYIITGSKTAELAMKLPSVDFEVNSDRLNAVVLYACKLLGVRTGFVEFDCNGIDAKTRKVRSDGTTTGLDSGPGSWLLKDFELAFVAPPAPTGPGTVTQQAATTAAFSYYYTYSGTPSYVVGTASAPATVDCFTTGTQTACTKGYQGTANYPYNAEIKPSVGWRVNEVEYYSGATATGTPIHTAQCSTTNPVCTAAPCAPCTFTVPATAYTTTGAYTAKIILSQTAAAATTATLTVTNTAGTNGGTGTVSGPSGTGITNCAPGATTGCSGTVSLNTPITLTATPATTPAGITVAWSETGCTGNTCAVTLTTAKTVTATFNAPAAGGGGGGTGAAVTCKVPLTNIFGANAPPYPRTTWTTPVGTTTLTPKDACTNYKVFGTGTTTFSKFTDFTTSEVTATVTSEAAGTFGTLDFLTCTLPCTAGTVGVARNTITKCKALTNIPDATDPSTDAANQYYGIDANPKCP